MKLEWFEDFLTLAREGNFSRTARQRNVAQPALSRRIRSLEDWAGTPLFDRDSHPIGLTEEGRLLRPVAEDVVRLVNQGRELIRQSVAGANVLKFESTHTVSILFFPGWLASLAGMDDQTGLSLQANHMDSCAKALIHGDCHFMLCLTNPDVDLGFDQAEYLSKIVGRDLLIPVSAASADGKPIFQLPGDPANPIPHLVYSEPSALGQMVDALLSRRGAHSFMRRYSDSPAADNLKSLVEEQHGVAWIAKMRAVTATENRPLVQAGDETWHIPVEIRVFKAKGNLPRIAEDFWERIIEH